MDFGGANRRRSAWLAALAMAIAWHMPARAEWSAKLPMFKACAPATPPDLPMRWHAVGLMMPFQQGQLDVGEFEYDGALPAMRATVYGLKSGAVDLLITEQDTYVLDGPRRSPTGCTSLGPKLRPPSAQWLSSQSVCVGESPLATEAVQWWQKPGFDVARYWFTTKSRLPWRSLFLRRSLDPAVIGDYAMTYFPAFTPLPETNLSALQDLCTATARSGRTEKLGATPTARELMAIRNRAAEAEREERIGELIPGLSYGACSRMTPARWPDRFVMSAIVTPIRINDVPYSTLIYYDWSGTQTLLILPFHSYPPALQGILSLKNRVGYRLKFSDVVKKTGVCRADLPGAVRPDWMTAASCECQGVIARNPALSPNAETQILSCPIKKQAPRIMWSWYTTQGQPIMFTEASPEGGGVMLADYDDWLPGQTGQASDFELPNACTSLDNSGADATGSAAPTFSNVSCSDCHSTRQ
jgi:hypothetical protein